MDKWQRFHLYISSRDKCGYIQLCFHLIVAVVFPLIFAYVDANVDLDAYVDVDAPGTPPTAGEDMHVGGRYSGRG